MGRDWELRGTDSSFSVLITSSCFFFFFFNFIFYLCDFAGKRNKQKKQNHQWFMWLECVICVKHHPSIAQTGKNPLLKDNPGSLRHSCSVLKVFYGQYPIRLCNNNNNCTLSLLVTVLEK